MREAHGEQSLRRIKLAIWDFPGGSDSKASVCNAGDLGLIPGSGRFPGEGNGNPLQYSFLENPMDGGAWYRLWGHKESDTTEQLSMQPHTPIQQYSISKTARDKKV